MKKGNYWRSRRNEADAFLLAFTIRPGTYTVVAHALHAKDTEDTLVLKTHWLGSWRPFSCFLLLYCLILLWQRMSYHRRNIIMIRWPELDNVNWHKDAKRSVIDNWLFFSFLQQTPYQGSLELVGSLPWERCSWSEYIGCLGLVEKKHPAHRKDGWSG